LKSKNNIRSKATKKKEKKEKTWLRSCVVFISLDFVCCSFIYFLFSQWRNRKYTQWYYIYIKERVLIPKKTLWHFFLCSLFFTCCCLCLLCCRASLFLLIIIQMRNSLSIFGIVIGVLSFFFFNLFFFKPTRALYTLIKLLIILLEELT